MSHPWALAGSPDNLAYAMSSPRFSAQPPAQPLTVDFGSTQASFELLCGLREPAMRTAAAGAVGGDLVRSAIATMTNPLSHGAPTEDTNDPATDLSDHQRSVLRWIMAGVSRTASKPSTLFGLVA